MAELDTNTPSPTEIKLHQKSRMLQVSFADGNTFRYERIARTVLRRVRAQRLLLEYDDARSGSFEPLREVPEVKLVVLGLITTKRPRLEPITLADQERKLRLVVETARRVWGEDAALRSSS